MTFAKTTPPVLTKGVPTEVFANNNHIRPQTPRKQYCLTGSYFGVVPTKLANGRLLWPDVIVTKSGAIAANDAFVEARNSEAAQ
ncbi:hypothetical protein GO287_02042 [Ralstonia solanacearum]|uniref:hypothetical protein n=1 Tax=Ralstonia pseudosolanacearum TaxID=1310165 RepID=UPI0016ACF625|nr:hypothetical protein [Ralstonia pseudosolanacearum]KAF3461263.1 hypothetical protein GO278_000766 [Ralstonia solanacearum]NKA77631.1 hypothetical protein [Ralstonia solanacearum]NKG00115.1 hypothetical protein [Ralstonia solanacearum]NKG04836.1 hypothetical protein [Ralstonia solanacearum]UNJ30236.1 hypothetical protein MNY32_02655 [Ralstonia pseudosolanacearum]